MLFREIEPGWQTVFAGADTTFRLDNYLLPQGRAVFQDFTDDGLGLAPAVDIGGIEQVDTNFEGGVQGRFGVFNILVRDRVFIPFSTERHTAEHQAAGFDAAFF